MKMAQRVLSLALCVMITAATVSTPSVAHADWDDFGLYTQDRIDEWLGTKPFGGWNLVDAADALLSYKKYSSSKPQRYYTTPTSSVQDKNGNVTNYYRSGDTTTTNIIDSYNKTFNTIHNTTNNTNNYQANVKLSNFLNQYTTNNNNYTYSADFKSWYYDNTTNNYNYTTNNLYYNEDNSRYYLTIDNSTDEYYFVDVQYSPTFVTVNYTYNNTVNNNEKPGDVTNVYYYELKDGRNSSTLTAAEVAGIDFGYDVKNYELVTDDPNTLSLQHFDGNYDDSSSFGRTFYSENRSSNYVDSGAFGKAVSLPKGSAAGVTIPGLSSKSSLTFDFRVYYNAISSLGIYFGNTNLLQEIPSYRKWTGYNIYTDNGTSFCASHLDYSTSGVWDNFNKVYSASEIGYSGSLSSSKTLVSGMTVPTSYSSPGYSEYVYTSKRYGWFTTSGAPVLYNSTRYLGWYAQGWMYVSGTGRSAYHFRYRNEDSLEYRWTPPQSVHANFSYDTYKNQWVSMRITISGGNIYYFVNGDLVGAGAFTKPIADKFYIKSSGTVYLDELRVTTGSLSSTSPYNPSNAPYDTNKVLALPDKLVANTIYVQHTIPVVDHRIGGVRPSNPVSGFFYIPLHEDHAGGQPQLYDGSNWVNVTAMVYDGKTLHNALGFKFSPVGSSPDVDMDAKPERPVKPGDNVDPETCTHDWEEDTEAFVSPTCVLAGSKTFVCSKCERTKKESIALLDHDWAAKITMPNQYDENGNQTSFGFTIYECLRCGEQYKSTDGTTPPAIDIGNGNVTPGGDGSGDDEPEKEGFLSWLLGKIGEFFGAIGDGVISLLKAALGKVLDGLIELISMVFDKLSQLVDLFGSFGDALGVLWTWLPPEIVLVLVAGVTVFVFIGVLKLFMK